MRSILVTGGAGFIGSNFVRYMLSKYSDYQIIVLDALTYAGNLDNLTDLKSNRRFTFHEGNICDKRVVAELMEKSDLVVNFAAETHVDRSIQHAGDFIETDIRGTFVLLETVREFQIERYLQISTDEVYGSIEDGSFKETDPLKPNSPYAASKAGADLLVRSYFATYQTPVLITRSSNNYGPYQYPEKLIPLFITNAIDNLSLPLYGDGKNVRDWLYVLDNCEAIDLVLHKGDLGQVYNIGAGNEEENITITRSILKLLGKPPELITYVKDRPGHDRRYSVNIDKIRTLGWQPKKAFEQAIQETVLWYRENENWWRKIKEKQDEYKRFYNVQYGKE
jgi:dTDP-glucose 4,6-dehydratase